MAWGDQYRLPINTAIANDHLVCQILKQALLSIHTEHVTSGHLRAQHLWIGRVADLLHGDESLCRSFEAE